MKITESRLRQIIKEELIINEFAQLLNEQTPEQITRLKDVIRGMLTNPSDLDHVIKALKHISTPETKDDTKEDYFNLGKVFADILHTNKADLVAKLLRIVSQMAKEKKKPEATTA